MMETIGEMYVVYLGFAILGLIFVAIVVLVSFVLSLFFEMQQRKERIGEIFREKWKEIEKGYEGNPNSNPNPKQNTKEKN